MRCAAVGFSGIHSFSLSWYWVSYVDPVSQPWGLMTSLKWVTQKLTFQDNLLRKCQGVQPRIDIDASWEAGREATERLESIHIAVEQRKASTLLWYKTLVHKNLLWGWYCSMLARCPKQEAVTTPLRAWRTRPGTLLDHLFLLHWPLYPLPHFLHILVWVTITVIKHHEQKQVGEEKVYLAYVFTSVVYHW